MHWTSSTVDLAGSDQRFTAENIVIALKRGKSCIKYSKVNSMGNLIIHTRAFIFMLFLGLQLVSSAQKTTEKDHFDNSKERVENIQIGKNLRLAIDEAYRRLADTKALGRLNMITSLVAKFIPPGTGFEKAEAILVSAGFELGLRAPNPRRPNDIWVIFSIDQYRPTFFGKTSVGVMLKPLNTGDWKTVVVSDADIYIQYV